MDIRKATGDDVGRLAYLLLQWNAELPWWLRQLEGGAQHAQSVAEIVTSDDRFHMYVLENEGTIVGGFCVFVGHSIFSLYPHGQLLMWYVQPKHRGGLHGIRLLKRAEEVAASLKLSRLEAYPWADDKGALAVLPRMGFDYVVNTFCKRLGAGNGQG